MVTGTAEGLGVKSLGEDLGMKMRVAVWTDSDACRSVANRRGLGKLRHVEVKYLWVQDVVKEGRVEMRRVKGEYNIADHLPKPKRGAEMEWMIGEMGGVMVWSGGGSAQSNLGNAILAR